MNYTSTLMLHGVIINFMQFNSSNKIQAYDNAILPPIAIKAAHPRQALLEQGRFQVGFTDLNVQR